MSMPHTIVGCAFITTIQLWQALAGSTLIVAATSAAPDFTRDSCLVTASSVSIQFLVYSSCEGALGCLGAVWTSCVPVTPSW